jgi:hypothetical protein
MRWVFAAVIVILNNKFNIYRYLQAFADLSKNLKPLVDGVKDNKQHWLELAQTAQETIKNRKNSIKSMSNGSVNNNYYTSTNGSAKIDANTNINNNDDSITNNNNNNSGDEMNNASNDSSMKMSKIVGKFPLDGITNSIFTPTYIKPSQNGFATYKSPAIVRYESWKRKESEEVMDQ